MTAETFRVRKGSKSESLFGNFKPDEQRGIKRKVVVEAVDPPASRSFNFRKRPQNIGTLSAMQTSW